MVILTRVPFFGMKKGAPKSEGGHSEEHYTPKLNTPKTPPINDERLVRGVIANTMQKHSTHSLNAA